ncbi:MAG: hypothetical protein AABY83_05865 [Pseudomonadota bacterium]
MTFQEDASDIAGKYRVISVEKSDPPSGMTGDNWYRYIIGAGNSKVIGCKPGTLNTVTEHAQIAAADLNARSTRVGSIYAPRSKK